MGLIVAASGELRADARSFFDRRNWKERLINNIRG